MDIDRISSLYRTFYCLFWWVISRIRHYQLDIMHFAPEGRMVPQVKHGAADYIGASVPMSRGLRMTGRHGR